jgi:hypothetical protein
MATKVAKLKRDGMRDSRGTYERFSTEPAKHVARAPREPGWYVTGDDKAGRAGTYRGAARSYGPFATQEDARRFARGMFLPDTFKTFQHAPRAKDAAVTVVAYDRDALVAEYRAKQAAQKVQRAAEIEAAKGEYRAGLRDVLNARHF